MLPSVAVVVALVVVMESFAAFFRCFYFFGMFLDKNCAVLDYETVLVQSTNERGDTYKDQRIHGQGSCRIGKFAPNGIGGCLGNGSGDDDGNTA